MRNRAIAITGAASAVVLILAGCSSESGGGGGGGEPAGDGQTIAFLMPDRASTRYEEQDRPLFEAKVAELCPDCNVLYQNADGDPGEQQQQANSAIAQGASVLVLDAVDTAAAASIVTSAQSQGVTVITYDRPISDAPADYYVSFDNEAIGSAIAQSLVDRLDTQSAAGGLLIVNGSPTDQAAGLIKSGIEAAVAASGYEVLASFDTPAWDPQEAQDWVSGQITQFGGESIAGIVAANDGTAGGAIAALAAAGVAPIPPVTGNDAEVAAIQRIIGGAQYNTISKPISIVAEAAAEVAVAFLEGEAPEAPDELFGTPTELFEPTVVTLDNVVEIIFDAGIYSVEEICTEDYAQACSAAGIT